MSSSDSPVPASGLDRQPERLAPDDRRIALWLALCVFAALLPFVHGRFSGSDEVGVYETTRALYERASLSLGDVGDGLPHIYGGRGGERFSHFAPGQAVLALPFFGLGRAASWVLPEWLARALAGPVPANPGAGAASGEVELFFVTLYGPAATAALAALFFAFQRRLGASRWAALWASALVCGTTYVAAQSVFFLRHTTEAVCVLGGLYWIFVYARTGSLRAAALGSAFASAVFLVRVPAALAGIGIAGHVVWALARRAREARDGEGSAALRDGVVAIGVPFAIATLLYVATNWWRWERWFGSPMFDQAVGFVTPIQVGLQGFLLSPGCSVFVHAPLLLLLPWMFGDAWRNFRAEWTAIVSIALAFLVVCSTYLFWTGLWSAPGPRYVFVAIPLLLLPLGRLLDRWRDRPARHAVAALGLAGLFVQLLLLLARWPAVIRLMEWQENYGPMMEFVFVAADSPLVGSARAIAQGLVDSWLFVTWTGAPTLPAQPGIATVAAVACLVLAAASGRGLARALRDAA